MTTPRSHESLWNGTAPLDPRDPLAEDVRADVAIVGAGIVGVTAAYLLAQEGVPVVVLERDRMLRGVTGKTTAKVTSQHGLVYRKLVDKFGEAKARQHGDAGQAALALVRRLVAETGADAKLTDAPNHVYTTDPARVAELRDEAEVSARLGLPATFTTETELPFPVEGAVRFEAQAHFHPVRYLAKLAEKAEARGARFFERTPVLDIEDGAPCEITAEGGTVRAKHVLVATNVPVGDKAFFVTRMKAKRDYALAFPYRGPELRGMYVNVDEPHRSVRPYAGDAGPMLVVAGEMHVVGEREPEDHYARLEAFARQHFQVGEPAYAWSTQDYFPVDDLAFIGKHTPRAKHAYAATGFRAWGMTQGTVAAMMFRDKVLGRENPWWDLYDPFAAGRVVGDLATREFYEESGIAVRELVGQRLQRHPAEDLTPGEGQIARVGGKLVAMSKDQEGTVRVVSATCSHMGCVLSYNALESSFDCRCHGSRFALDGSVLHGPAVKPLEVVEAPKKRTTRLGSE